MKKFKTIHPFLFALYPVLSLYTHNIDKMELKETLLPALISLCGTIIIWLALSLIFKKKEKAGIITSIFLLFFFSYGRILDNIYGTINWLRLKEEYFLYTWIIILLFSGLIIANAKRTFHTLTKYLNIVSVFLIILPLVSVGSYLIFEKKAVTFEKEQKNKIIDKKRKRYPDIYYIILDGYGRHDILKKKYHYDNKAFIKFLKKQGFYIASKSKANYPQTEFSLASSMNLIYLDEIAEKMGTNSENRAPLRKMIKYNKVSRFLKDRGYTYIAFSTGIACTEAKNADIYLTPKWFLNEFDNILICTTPLPIILEKFFHKTQHDLHRKRILYILDKLPDISDEYSPFFLFAHIMCPHPPFLFDEIGNPIVAEEKFSFADGRIMKIKPYMKYYSGQISFITKRIEIIIDKILKRSNGKSIIILQGDHGPGGRIKWTDYTEEILRERMSILNAYYLPGRSKRSLYQDITPVNSFRIIFNLYFNRDFELLDDKIYYNPWYFPYNFTNVTAVLRE